MTSSTNRVVHIVGGGLARSYRRAAIFVVGTTLAAVVLRPLIA